MNWPEFKYESEDAAQARWPDWAPKWWSHRAQDVYEALCGGKSTTSLHRFGCKFARKVQRERIKNEGSKYDKCPISARGIDEFGRLHAGGSQHYARSLSIDQVINQTGAKNGK